MIKLFQTVKYYLTLPDDGFVRFTKKSLIFSSLLLVILSSIILYSLFIIPKSVSAAWFNDNWVYRQAITVTVTSSSSDISNLETLLTVNTSSLIGASKLQSSCQDLRFTNTNGKLLYYYIASGCNSTTTKIWVMADLVPKNTTTYTLYMYYGNPSAVAGSNSGQLDNVVNLQGYYTFNESSWNGTSGEIKDSSVSSINGTASKQGTEGIPTTTSGNYGNAGSFTGNNTGNTQYADMGNNFDRDASTSFTIEAWAKYSTQSSSLNNYPGIIWKGSSPHYGLAVITSADANNNKPYIEFTDGTHTSTVIASSAENDNNWHHYALVLDRSGQTLTLYIDGSSQGSTSTSSLGSLSNARDFVVGTRDAGGYEDGFTGLVDDVKIYTGTRTPAQITADKNNTSCGGFTCTIATTVTATSQPSTSFATEEVATAPLAYWKFDEGYGGITSDDHYSQSGTVTNLITNPSIETNTTGWTTNDSSTLSQDSSQHLFGTYSLSALKNALNCCTSAWFTLSASASTTYTFTAWVKSDPGASGRVYLRGYDGTSDTDSTAINLSSDTNWQRLVVTKTTAIGTTQVNWQVVSDSQTDSTHKFYIDGVQVEQSSTASNYCDGSLLGNGTHSWNGTANASTSTCSSGSDGMVSSPNWQTEDQCISGKCLYFDGSASKVGVSKPINGVQTVAFWVKPNAFTSTTPLIDLDGGTHVITTNSSGVISATGFTSPTIYINGQVATTLAANTWQFVEVTTGSSFNTTASLTIGNSSSNFLEGFMDEVKLYGYARSATQVQADYSARGNNEGLAENQGNAKNIPGALNNGLVGYWKMDESSGNASDSSGNGFTATLGASDSFGAGKFGNSMNNSGSGAGATVSVGSGSAMDFTSSSHPTIAFWLKVTSLASDARLIERIAAGGWGVEYSSTGTLKLITFGGATVGWSSTVSADSIFHHYVISYDGTNASLYKDGTLVSTQAYTAGWTTQATALNIGGDASYPLRGNLDDIRVYNRALSAQDASNLYNFAPGPLAYWNFDEGSGTTFNDQGTAGDSASLTVGASGSQTTTSQAHQSGKYGKAIHLDGTDDYATAADLDFANAMTGEVWIKFDSVSAQQFILAQSTTDEYQLQMQGSGNSQKFRIRVDSANGLDIVDSTTQATTNTWYHVAWIYDGTDVTLYVNGVNETNYITNTGSGAINDVNQNIGIGARNDGTGPVSGTIDEVRIYNYARNSQQVVEDMNAGHPPPGSPVGTPVGYWKFNEGYGTTANNSGNGGTSLAGTLTNMASPATTTSGWTQSGEFGRALNFDGTNDYVSVTDNAATRITGDITLSAWVKPTDFTNTAYVIGKMGSSSSVAGPYYLRIDSSTGALRLSRGNGTTQTTVTSTTALTAGVWSHVVATMTGTTYTFYINGVPAGTGTLSATTTDSGQPLYIGTDGSLSLLFKGAIDEPKVYDFALTSDQVKLDMNRGQAQVLGALSDNSSYQPQAAAQEYCIPGDSSSCTSPVGRWDFEEGSGTTANDTSGNGNTLTAIGTTITQGRIGKGRNFNGTSDYICSGTSGTCNTGGTTVVGTNSFYAEAWIKTVDSSDVQMIIGDYDSANSGLGAWFLDLNDAGTNKLRFDIIDASTGSDNLTTAAISKLTDGTWHFIAVGRNSSTQEIYVDGQLVASQTQHNYNANTAASFMIGADCAKGSPAQAVCVTGNTRNFFKGSIDGAKLFMNTRTAAQVAWDYNRGAPVGWWKMDECQGTVANDSSSNGNAGTITIGASGTQTAVGTCTDGNAAHAWSNGKVGKYNSSLNFDGTDDYVSVPTISIPSDITASAWVYSSNFGGNMFVVQKENVNSQWELFFEGGYLKWRGGSTTAITCTAPSNNNWHHIAGIQTGTTATLYIDGAQCATGSVTAIANASNPIDIGAYHDSGGGYFFNGQIDDVRVYNYPLTANQIKQVYNQGAAYRVGPVTGAP